MDLEEEETVEEVVMTYEEFAGKKMGFHWKTGHKELGRAFGGKQEEEKARWGYAIRNIRHMSVRVCRNERLEKPTNAA